MAKTRLIILTRYNIPFSTWKHLLNDEWMEHRFQIFDNICYPSMEGQTNKDFIWLLFCNPATKDKWKRKINGYRLITPVYCDWPDRAKYINRYAGDADILITTRLDNDDALNRFAINRIQTSLKDRVDCFLNFPNVLVTDGHYIAKYTEPSNPFISYVETPPFRNVWSVKHGEARYAENIIQDESLCAGLRIIHGKNASNSLGTRVFPLETSTAIKDFTINIDFLKNLK